MSPLFTPYLQRWQLEQDGKAFETHSSLLMPVRYRGEAAMLKIAREQEERFGGQLMCWWRGGRRRAGAGVARRRYSAGARAG